MRTQTALVLLVALGSAAFAGCGASSGPADSPTGKVRASLHRAKSCGDLLTDLKTDAKVKLDRAIDRAIQDVQRCVTQHGDAQCGYGGYLGGGYGGRNSVDLGAAESAPTAGAPAPASASDGATSYSETNTQVKGVDEADIVKNDGKNLYVLHGRAFKIVRAYPPQELADAASIDIEGTPSEMFVDGGRAVVYSTVNGTTVFQAAGVTPKASYQDFGYPTGGGMAVARPAGMEGGAPSDGASSPYAPLTKITVLDLSSGTPTVAREVYFEGSYLTARRVGTHVRTVLQGRAYGPKLAYSTYELQAQQTGGASYDETTQPKTGTEVIAELEQLRAHNRSAVDGSALGDWLPYTFVKNGAAVTPKTVACEDFYVPAAGSQANGLTEVATIDLANPAAEPRETAILGRSDTVYANATKMVLAGHGWVEPPYVDYGSGDTVSSDGSVGAAPPPTTVTSPGTSTSSLRPLDNGVTTGSITAYPTSETHVHELEFATDPTFPNYVASGSVVGSVKNQFSIDEVNDQVRIATTEHRLYVDDQNRYVSALPNDPTTGAPSPRPSDVNHVFVLGATAPSELNVIGKAEGLAPNEQIYSVRFLGSRAYVVTFRRVDPLFVIDLSQPTQPTVLAALKIPGFSEYMHPLDENHLLTIGRDAGTDGRVRGLQLQIFDVTNGANPVLQHKFTYTGQEYGQSEATYDHKAFTYFAERKLLAFPYYAYNDSGMRSSLELFKVDLTAGFAKVGSVDHTALLQQTPTGYCGGYYGPSVRRGVFMDDFVYSISYAGVVVRNASAIDTPVGQLALSAPQTNEGYGPACY